jgi:hypothetical protein
MKHNLFYTATRAFTIAFAVAISPLVSTVSVWAESPLGESYDSPVRATHADMARTKVEFDGIGPVKVGMTVTQASRIIGHRLVPGVQGRCSSFKPQNDTDNISFVVVGNHIARVDIEEGSRVKTLKGAGIGNTEAQIKSLYPGQIKVTPSKNGYNGHLLTLIPNESHERDYRIVFETDGDSVIRYSVGKLPEIKFVGSCL